MKVVFSVGSTLGLYSEDPHWLVSDSQLTVGSSVALCKEVELTADKSSVVAYLPDSNDVSVKLKNLHC